MKEKDLEKMLDSMIVDGLIKEAEQDNADFQNAMKLSEFRNMPMNEFVPICVLTLKNIALRQHLCLDWKSLLFFNLKNDSRLNLGFIPYRQLQPSSYVCSYRHTI